MRIVVDTNVIFDFFLFREPHYESAKEIFKLNYQKKIEAFTTASSVTDIFFISEKFLGNEKARQVIHDVLDMLKIIEVDGIDCRNALKLAIPDFEDALVIVCADKVNIDFIVTRDEEFLKVQNAIAPDEFLKKINP